MKSKRFLEKYFSELSKHYIAIATALFIGFALALFLKRENISALVLIIAIIFYIILITVALLFSYISSQFSNETEGEHDA